MRQDNLQYTTAALLVERIGVREVMELTTEDEEVREATPKAVDMAADWVDGVSVDDTEIVRTIGKRIKRALVHAEGQVNSRVGAAYSLPAYAPDGTVPSEIEDACLVLAEGRLRERRDRVSYMSGEETGIARRVKRTDKWLKEVAAGKAIIAKLDNTGTEQAETRSGPAFGHSSNSKFSKWQS